MVKLAAWSIAPAWAIALVAAVVIAVMLIFAVASLVLWLVGLA